MGFPIKSSLTIDGHKVDLSINPAAMKNARPEDYHKVKKWLDDSAKIMQAHLDAKKDA